MRVDGDKGRMISILGDHNWTWVLYHMLFCKLVIFSLCGIPVKDTIQHTNKKAVVGSLVDFNVGLWQKGKISFYLSWKQLYGKGIAGYYYLSLPTVTNTSQFTQINRCSSLHLQVFKETNLPDSLFLHAACSTFLYPKNKQRDHIWLLYQQI